MRRGPTPGGAPLGSGGRGALTPRALIGLSLLGLALTGCAANEHLAHRAPIDGSALGLGATPAPPIDARWWEAFGDPQLNALVERATRDSPTLAQALARVARAEAETRLAASARGLQVNGSADVLRAYYNAGALPVPENFGSGSAWGSVANLGLSWNLDFWGRQRDLVREADRLGRAGAFDARAAALSLEGSIVSTYIELDRDHALAEIAAEVERNRAELAELERRRVSAGLDTTVELRTAAARIPEVRVDREQARSRIDIGVHELAELSGQGAALYGQVTRPRLNGTQALALPSSLPGDLLLRRPDVAAALARVESASAGEDAARLAAYPDIELRGLGGFAALSLSDLLERPARVFAAGPALALPIFDAGRIRAEHRAANADLDLAVAQYDATVLQAVREAADQLTTLAALEVVIADQQRNLDLLTEARALAEERYQAGLTTRQLVLDAEARLLTVRSALVSSRALAAEVRVALLVAVGGSTTPVAAQAARASL